MKSDITKKGLERATHRALYYSMGHSREDLKKPLIGIVNKSPGYGHRRLIPSALAQVIHNRLGIPTISVGAGPDCTGCNLNAYDILGIFDQFVPKFVKQYRQVGQDIVGVFNAWHKDISEKQYPLPEHSFNVGGEEITKLYGGK